MVLGEKTDTRSPGTHLRWLHLSDFHIETDPPWKGRPSLRALIRHLGELREQGLAPDLVFVTGDVARNGRDHFTVAGVDDLLVIPTPINESLTPGVSALRELTTIDDRSEAKPLLATALTRLAGDGWIALMTSAEATDDERRAYFHRRVLNAWLLQAWPGVDRQLEEQPDPGRLALYLALGWTQATTTRQWPATERWIALLAGDPPDDWLPRSQWHLCWLLHDPEDAGHRQALDEALGEGLGDAGRPGLAAELQKLFPRSEEESREEIPGVEA